MSDVIVITGLAQGMGREVAKMLVSAGHRVAGFDMDAEGIESLQRDLDAYGSDHLLEELDIRNRSGILAFRDRVLEKLMPLLHRAGGKQALIRDAEERSTVPE